MSRLGLLAGVGLGAALLGGGVLVRVFRARDARLLRPLIAWQRRSLNPRNLRTVGTPGAPWAVVRHTGRSSSSTGDGMPSPPARRAWSPSRRCPVGAGQPTCWPAGSSGSARRCSCGST
ncbi:hypothetical protein [Serinicoccus hydrothermalis]|uniref:hypothetical protein n=1 Tax=Serinicoccus hydrothermalis TaxID=1758689 RepID=UPI0008315ECD|nr:hypothetical protein [Serinicoccus hydrothermalis]